MLIPIPIGRTDQPPLGALVDQTHYLASKLRCAYTGNERCGTILVNAVHGRASSVPIALFGARGIRRAYTPIGYITTRQSFTVSFVTGSDVTSFQHLFGSGGQYASSGDFSTLGLRIDGGYLRGCSAPAYNDLSWFDNLKVAISANRLYTATFVLRGWGSGVVGELWLNGLLVSTYTGTTGTHGSNANITIGAFISSTGATVDATFTGQVLAAFHHGTDLDGFMIEMWHRNIWQIFEPEIMWVEVGGGGTSYTESLTTLADAYATVTGISTYIDAAQAIITAGVSVADTTTMLESVLVTAQAADSITALATRADNLLAVIQAADSVQSSQAMIDNLIVSAGATATVTDSQTGAGLEALQSAASAADSVQDVVVALEQFSTTISAQATVVDNQIAAAAENLLTAATAITSVTDLQLMTDNLTIIATSGASIGEIGAYLEQLAAAATGQASVIDVLVGSFIGRHLAVEYAAGRSFAELATARSFIEYAAPRGARA